MRSKLRARTPIIALAFICIAVLFIASCTTNEVGIPDLTGPSGTRLFITIEASPDKVFIRKPNNAPGTSRVTLQLKNQLGQGVPNARIAVRITNADGSEVGIGTLDHLTVITDSGGFARVTYTAPSTAQQPVPVQVFLRAILTDPAFAFEVVSTIRLDLELAKPFDCVDGPGGPVVSFTISPASPAEDEEVCFDAQGTTDNGAIISFTWNFGDGRTDTGPLVCHIFTSQGQFPVTLTVIDGDQNCASLTQVVDVGAGGSPACVFTASPNPVNTDTTVFFDATGSSDSDGTIVSFSWNFGDGSTRSGEQVTHSFSSEQTFTVSLTVRDNAGNESTCTQSITVTSGLPDCSSFTVDPASPDANEPVTFDASSVTDPDGGNLEFRWDFGDGSCPAFSTACGTGPVVAHTFTSSGTFLVRLRVEDDSQNVVVCTKAVIVGNLAPVCTSFTADKTTVEPGENVTFTATGNDPDGGAVTFNFLTPGATPSSSGTQASGNFVTSYNTSGTASVVITDDEGATAPASAACAPIQITVEEPPDSAITSFNPTFGCVGDLIVINGSGFTGSTDVTFKDTTALFGVVNDTTINATVPVPTTNGDGPITVTTPNGTVSSSPNNFNTITQPTVTGYTPASGAIGATIQINGTNFRGATSVLFTGAGGDCTVTASFTPPTTDTQISATVPAGAITGPVCVVNCALTSDAATAPDFTVTP